MKTLKITVLSATLLVLSQGAGQAQYIVSEPASIGGVGIGAAHGALTGINSLGDVCGDAPDPTFTTMQAFGFTPSAPNAPYGTFGSLGSPASSYGPTWTNCRGVSTYAAVGFGWDSDDGSVIAMRFKVGAGVPGVLPVKLSRLTEDPAYIPNSYAYAVNNTGLAVGMLEVSPGVNHAVYWQLTPTGDKGMVDISHASADWVLTAAYGVNNLGQIVGVSSYKSTGKVHAFLYTIGKGAIDLGVLDTTPGADFSVATAINDMGVVVGYAGKKDFMGMAKVVGSAYAPFHHCFAKAAGGTMSDLGMPPALPGMPPNKNCIAWAINNNNEIAGWANPIAGGASMMMGTAVLHEPSPAKFKIAMTPGWNNLNLLPKTGLMIGIFLRAAVAINNFGQILAPGSPELTMAPAGLGESTFPYALLLTPPPPPPASKMTNF